MLQKSERDYYKADMIAELQAEYYAKQQTNAEHNQRDGRMLAVGVFALTVTAMAAFGLLSNNNEMANQVNTTTTIEQLVPAEPQLEPQLDFEAEEVTIA